MERIYCEKCNQTQEPYLKPYFYEDGSFEILGCCHECKDVVGRVRPTFEVIEKLNRHEDKDQLEKIWR